MAGKKGRSGRKPNTDGITHRPVNLYIPMEELDVGSGFGQGEARYEWIPQSWFRQFKRMHGSRWQEQVRKAIRTMVTDYEERRMWRCKCPGRIKSTHFMHEGQCPRCEYTPGELQRYKSVATARIHATDEPIQKPLSLCPGCRNPYELKLDVHGRKLMVCRTCQK